MLKIGALIRNPFSFLFTRSSAEEQVVAYLTREHRRGRSIADADAGDTPWSRATAVIVTRPFASWSL